MKKSYLVTITVALYNCEKYIERCLKSLLGQTYQNIEILVINDGSTDDSLKIVNNFKDQNDHNNKIKIFSKSNEGLALTRNYGIKESSGEFILMLDSDDWLEPNTIENLVKIQQKNNSDITKMSYFVNTNENKNINVKNNYQYSDIFINLSKSKQEIARQIIIGEIPAYTWTMLIRKSIITEEYLFEQNVYLEDKIFLLKLINNSNGIYFSDFKGYHYFTNINGLTHNNKAKYYLMQDLEINKRIKNILNKYYNRDKKLLVLNDTMTYYFVERNLFNVYCKNGREEAINIYNEISDDIKKISKNLDVSLLFNNDYTTKKDNIIKLLLKEDFDKIFKIYKKDYFLINVKNVIKKIIKR